MQYVGVIQSASCQRCFLNLEFVSQLLELTNEKNYVYAWMQSLSACTHYLVHTLAYFITNSLNYSVGIGHDIKTFAEANAWRQHRQQGNRHVKVIEKYVKIDL